MIKKIVGVMIIVLFLCLSAQPSFATIIIAGDGAWGDFTANFTYNAISATAAKISIVLMNTSPVANGGYLTGFVFNNPSNFITNATSTSFSNTNFRLLGINADITKPNFQNGAIGYPYGNFDIGAAVGTTFLAGGAAQLGIPVNNSAQFIFNLAGNSLNTLNENSFVNEISRNGNEFFLARFRGFNNCQRDTVPGNVIPEPATMSLLGLGLLGLAGLKRRKKCGK